LALDEEIGYDRSDNDVRSFTGSSQSHIHVAVYASAGFQHLSAGGSEGFDLSGD